MLQFMKYHASQVLNSCPTMGLTCDSYILYTAQGSSSLPKMVIEALTLCISEIHPRNFEHVSTVLKLFDSLHHYPNPFLNQWLQPADIQFREERIQRAPSNLMLIMIDD